MYKLTFVRNEGAEMYPLSDFRRRKVMASRKGNVLMIFVFLVGVILAACSPAAPTEAPVVATEAPVVANQ